SFSGGATFYLAFNEADGNSSSSGDNIYIKTFTVSVLPVRWLDFSHRVEKGKLHLYWSTATEINNAKFVVERSSDGEIFDELGEIKGKGNSETVSHYSFVENEVPESKMYYRIKQVDFDGKFDFSKLISFDPNTSGIEDIQVNINGKKLRFSQPQQVKQVSIIGLDGKLMRSFVDVSESELTIDFLPTGVYVLAVETKESGMWYKKIWVQN
ncbi:MAG: T9SS type A sorting domain-containing protein, partial [Bacteroidia bacterium]|nr:T9SS type A sorting domain-containing protein [Bacteroidia bacterium]